MFSAFALCLCFMEYRALGDAFDIIWVHDFQVISVVHVAISHQNQLVINGILHPETHLYSYERRSGPQ